MGYASTGACFPTQQAALDHWCAMLAPGAYATSCSSCDASTNSCAVSMILPDSTTATVSLPVSTPSCVVPEPATDALAFTGAAVALWVLAWAGRSVYRFFRLPHHE